MSKIENDSFNFFVPCEIVKSQDKDSKKPDQRYIQGVASTDAKDLQNETIAQGGIDYSYFLKYGYINNNHLTGPENIVGEPTECRITKAGLWVKGFLYKGNKEADNWWNLLNTLDQSGASRKVGFSIEGKIQRREGNSILKCWLKNVAICESPVNPTTFVEIVKSLSDQKWCIHPWKSLEKACKGCPGVSVCKDTVCTDEKAKALTAGSAGMLIPQSLEGSPKVTTYKNIDLSTELSFDEAVKYVQLEKGFSLKAATIIVDSIFKSNGSVND